MVLLAIEDALSGAPGLYLQFGFSQHKLNKNNSLTVGHAVARVGIGQDYVLIDQSRDGSLLIGKEGGLINLSLDTDFYSPDEGYGLFLQTLYKMNMEDPPFIDRENILRVYRGCLASSHQT
jgi:hypothetical protein